MNIIAQRYDSQIIIEQVIGRLRSQISSGNTAWDQHYLYPDEAWTYDNPQDVAISYFDQAWLCLLSLLESTGQNYLFDKAKREFQEYKKDPLDGKMGTDEPYSLWATVLWNYHALLKSMYIPEPEQKNEKMSELITILDNCERYVQNPHIFSWLPCEEADVHDRIEELLGCYYPKLQRKPTITKPIKNFIPDTGLPSIKTLIEYKYVNSDADAKLIVDQILADLGGYQSQNYKHFVFVIYETRRHRRRAEWHDVLEQAKPPNPVEVVLLKGNTPTDKDISLASEHRKHLNEAGKKVGRKIPKKTR